jgi:hypothetical protein
VVRAATPTTKTPTTAKTAATTKAN